MSDKYVTTKEECERNIKGICEGCGGPLSAIETVDNSRRPTFWQGCECCSCFRTGVELRHFKVARKLVEERRITPYAHSYINEQTASSSRDVAYIERLLLEERGDGATKEAEE